ncbi:MAG: ABC transporter ATP-binding protein [Flavobacteriaceae bacterium]|nr:ABC transporter ATP-binding protein [Flavobacteriaceae bacterium]
MTENQKNIILEVRDLSIGYADKKKKVIVKNQLNFKANQGEFICLLGKNGVGKSTLLKTLSKVIPKLAGNILINKNEINKINSKLFSKILSVVLTERLPESNLTVFELVALGRQPHTNWVDNLSVEDLNMVNNALELTNTVHLKDKNIFELSDGQLQKVLISRALAQDTPIIIFDEPTAHLDIHHKIETFLLLKKLSKEAQKTIIISTHEIHWAIELADTIWLMTANNCYFDSPENLKNQERFQELFDSLLVTFDAQSNQFKISVP